MTSETLDYKNTGKLERHLMNGKFCIRMALLSLICACYFTVTSEKSDARGSQNYGDSCLEELDENLELCAQPFVLINDDLFADCLYGAEWDFNWCILHGGPADTQY